MTPPTVTVTVPGLSRRVVLGALASVLWPSRRLIGQDAGAQMIPVDGEGARYWPRWRGPSGQGLVSSGSYPDTWSATQNVLWKAAVPARQLVADRLGRSHLRHHGL